MRDATFRWTPVCGSCSTAFSMRIVMVHLMCMLWSTESIILVVYVVCTCTQSATCVLLVYVVCICTQSQTCIVQCQWRDVTLQRHAHHTDINLHVIQYVLVESWRAYMCMTCKQLRKHRCNCVNYQHTYIRLGRTVVTCLYRCSACMDDFKHVKHCPD